MATLEQNVMPQFADKVEALRIVDEQMALMGIAPGPALMAQEVQALYVAEGFAPNDNSFSRGIIKAREEKVRGSLEGWSI